MAQVDDRTTQFLKAAAGVDYFTDMFCMIDDAQGIGGSGGMMRFKLWPSQWGVLRSLLLERFVLILKARQLGISWLCCAYALWLCIFQDGKVVLIFSKGQKESDEMMRRIKVLFDRLPDWFRASLPKQIKDNNGEVEWANGSRIQSMPATESAGRSFTASLIILDEFAFMMWGDKLYTAAKPTIDAGGQMIILSTANGIGNAYHQLWVKAEAGLNRFTAIFLPFWARPGRDWAWRRQQESEELEPGKAMQEYPATSTEAFVSSGRSRFSAAHVEKQMKGKSDPIELPDVLQHLEGVDVYELPVADREYIIAADVAEGGIDGDFDDGVVMDRETWREVASISGKWEPDTFGDYLHKLAQYFNNAEITPERNNHGHALIVKLKALGAKIGRGDDGKMGWLTNAKTKPMMIDFMSEALRDGLTQFNNGTAINEMSIYERKENGSTGAPNGYHDDGVMSRAIALMRLRRPKPQETAQSTSTQKRYFN